MNQPVSKFIISFCSILRSYKLYDSLEHRLLREHLSNCFDVLHSLLESRGECFVDFVENEIFVYNRPITENPSLTEYFFNECYKRRISRISFFPGLSFSEFEAFLEKFLIYKDSASSEYFFGKDLWDNIQLSELKEIKNLEDSIEEVEHQQGKRIVEKRLVIEGLYKGLKLELRNLHQKILISPEASFVDSLTALRRISEDLLSEFQSFPFIAISVAVKSKKDIYGNAVNLAIFAAFLARKIELGDALMLDLFVACVLSDLGKYDKDLEFKIEDSKKLFKNPGVVAKASISGALRSLADSRASAFISLLIFKKDRKVNNSLLPQYKGGLNGDNLLDLVLKAARVYNHWIHLCSVSSKWKVFEFRAFVDELDLSQPVRNMLVLFFRELGPVPPGFYVKLSTNEIAQVLRPNLLKPFSPVVEIVYDNFGKKIRDINIVYLDRDPLYGELDREICSTIRLSI